MIIGCIPMVVWVTIKIEEAIGDGHNHTMLDRILCSMHTQYWTYGIILWLCVPVPGHADVYMWVLCGTYVIVSGAFLIKNFKSKCCSSSHLMLGSLLVCAASSCTHPLQCLRLPVKALLTLRNFAACLLTSIYIYISLCFNYPLRPGAFAAFRRPAFHFIQLHAHS